MKKWQKITVICLILALLGAFILCLPNQKQSGRADTYGKVTVVSLYGSWQEMGQQYGRLAKRQLEEVSTFCQQIVDASEDNQKRAESIIQQQADQTPYTIRQFFQGAVETSGLSLEELYLANAVERIAGLPKCSLAAVWGDYAKDGMVLGRNYDYGDIFHQLNDAVLVTVFHPNDGALATAIMGYAGEIYAVNGINEAGIFLELNNGKASAPISSPNKRITGTTVLLDVLFEADSLDLLDRYFNTNLCSSSYIINAADGNAVRSYEWCPIGVKHGEDYNIDGLLASTNHYVNPEWETQAATEENSMKSFTRRDNLIALCEAAKGTIDAAKMQEIIAVWVEDGGAANELTVYQLVVEPASRMLWIRTDYDDAWEQIDLKPYLAGNR